MIKILFLINTLGAGGAERVLVNLINNMDLSKFDITICTMFADGVNRQKLSASVKYYCKNPFHIKGLSKIIKFIPESLLYKFYIGQRKYDIVVAYLHGAPTKVISGCKDSSIKKVSWLHNGNPQTGTFFDFWIKRDSAFKAYNSMDAIIGVSKSVSEAFASYTGIKDKIHTLYNTNDINQITRLSNEKQTTFTKPNLPVICTSGRLVAIKGFDRLVDAARRLHSEGINFQIWILGDGPEKVKLENQISNAKASSYVKLLGFQENPYNIMLLCDGFISSSREEGLATVLTEALTLGLPVVSTNVSGAKEVLGENNEYGLVVENSTDGIYHGLKTILTNTSLTSNFKAKAQIRAKEFNTKSTVKKTESFFESLLN